MTVWMLFALITIGQISPSTYTQDMFRKALANSSTAPNYVLFTVQNRLTQKSRVVCTVAPFLQGAIHTEYELPYNEAGGRKISEILLASPGRDFAFSNPAALRNIEPRYSENQLNEVREILKDKSNQELVGGYDFERLLRVLIAGLPANIYPYGAYRDAIAHVLLERGILCGQGDITGGIYIDKS